MFTLLSQMQADARQLPSWRLPRGRLWQQQFLTCPCRQFLTATYILCQVTSCCRAAVAAGRHRGGSSGRHLMRRRLAETGLRVGGVLAGYVGWAAGF